MARYRTLFITERAPVHQQWALNAAPPELDVVMLRRPERAELLSYLADAVFLISERTGVIDEALLTSAPNLAMILRLGSMVHDIDLDAARRRGIVVATLPQPGVIMVAEHLVMQMLALVKHLREAESVTLAAGDWGASKRTDENTFAYNWSLRRNISGLWGKAVGIVGFGEIGAELARRLRGWDCRVLYNRRRRLPAEVEDTLGITYASWEDVLTASDFLVNLLPFFPETDMAINGSAFARMKRGACLVSCGSGSVIDEVAVADAIRSGRLGGVALDTFEWEPIRPDNPLRQLAVADPTANILLTPHTAAGAPAEGDIPSRSREYEPIVRFLRGEPVEYRLA